MINYFLLGVNVGVVEPEPKLTDMLCTHTCPLLECHDRNRSEKQMAISYGNESVPTMVARTVNLGNGEDFAHEWVHRLHDA